MWYYNLSPEAAAAAAAYWAAVDPYYYSYYQDNAVLPPVPPVPHPYYGYEYMYPHMPYGSYYAYPYDPYMTDTEYDTTTSPATHAPDCETISSKDEASSSAETDSEITTANTKGLQAIKSVTDIHQVYDTNENEDQNEAETETEEEDETEDEEEERFATPTNQTPPQPPNNQQNHTSDEDDDTEEDDDCEDSDEDEGMATADEHIPHQLSVIFEESDAVLSDLPDRRREASVISEDDSSTTIAVESDGEIDENMEETVTVRLPLRFKFSKTDEDEDVTTVIVGDSHVVAEDLGNNVSITVNIPAPPSRQSTANSLNEHSNEIITNCSECDSDSSDDDTSSSDAEDLESVKPLISTPQLEPEEIHVSVKDRIKAIERGDCEKSLLSDHDGKDVYDEDEVDSGVTSQTDTESDCFNEMRRCGSYKRAATHSRLYRLLHGQGDDDDIEDINETDVSEVCTKDQRPISLPLTSKSSKSSIPDSFPSSGIASPVSTPPRRPQSTIPMIGVESDVSTPGYVEEWSDYASYYQSWEDRSRMFTSPTIFTAHQRTSPFPLAIPRCPMTPCPGSEGS